MGRPHTDFTGLRCGSLVALRFAYCEKRPGLDNHRTLWYFQCDCGSIILRDPFSARRAKSPCCPSCRKGPNANGWKGVGEISGTLLSNYKYDAQRRGLSFNVSDEDLWLLFLAQDRKCALTGRVLQFAPVLRDASERSASLDRIDSARGYELNNVQWVHRDINRMKRNWTDERFIEICTAIAEYHSINRRTV